MSLICDWSGRERDGVERINFPRFADLICEIFVYTKVSETILPYYNRELLRKFLERLFGRERVIEIRIDESE